MGWRAVLWRSRWQDLAYPKEQEKWGSKKLDQCAIHSGYLVWTWSTTRCISTSDFTVPEWGGYYGSRSAIWNLGNLCFVKCWFDKSSSCLISFDHASIWSGYLLVPWLAQERWSLQISPSIMPNYSGLDPDCCPCYSLYLPFPRVTFGCSRYRSSK